MCVCVCVCVCEGGVCEVHVVCVCVCVRGGGGGGGCKILTVTGGPSRHQGSRLQTPATPPHCSAYAQS